MKITILGAGAFGSALGEVASLNGHKATFYDPFKFPDRSLAESLKGAKAVIYAAPSDQATKILADLPTDLPLICASKGFISLQPFSKFKSFSAIGGSAFADMLRAAAHFDENDKNYDLSKYIDTSTRLKTDSVIDNYPEPLTLTASSHLSMILFQRKYIEVETTPDTLGILLSGALKNVYAIGGGFYGKDVSNSDDDDAGSYSDAAMDEAQDVLASNGANPFTFLQGGALDFLRSCTPQSRNFRFGKSLRLHKAPENTTLEGLYVINSIIKSSDFCVPRSATILKDLLIKIPAAVNKLS